VAEGIAGCPPLSQEKPSGNAGSFLNSLREAGQQYVVITNVIKKNQVLMFEHRNAAFRYLQEAHASTAVCDRTVRWSVTYLVDKADVPTP
jgi:hypothetical protein